LERIEMVKSRNETAGGMKTLNAASSIARYARGQNPEHTAICHALRTEIDATLPQTSSKLYHGSPVWFVGENPVVGYSVTARKGVCLLFWNGQAFDEPGLVPVGKFRAAQIFFTDPNQIEAKVLRRWLKSAGKDIWDYRGYFLAQKALQKKAKAKRPARSRK
jgi:hypothetical protein